ncbi:MAG: large extracellular alpha-helical protein [Desulfatiglans sp.]|nr:large extracellular alpha-helical protein [Desulfatiglans sp.]
MATRFRILLPQFFFYMVFILPGHPITAQQANPGQPLQILNITPSGEDVPTTNKIVFQFNRAVVPVGAMDRKASEVPITINPEIKGRWRWLNTSALAYIIDDDSPLKPATRYEIEVRPGIKAENGATMIAAVRRTFITERPKVVHTWFKTWRSPTHPVVRVIFNMPVTKDSVEKHLYMHQGWLKEGRVKVKAEPDQTEKELPDILPLPGEEGMALVIPEGASKEEPLEEVSLFDTLYNRVAAFFTALFSDKSQQEKVVKTQEESTGPERAWVIMPEKELKENTTVYIRVEPGLEPDSGTEKGIEDRELVSFSTFPEFQFNGFECFDMNHNRISINPGDAPNKSRLCNPMQPVILKFSSPVLNSEIKKNVRFKPQLHEPESGDDEEDEYSQLNRPYSRDQLYYSYMPSLLKAAQDYQVSILPDLRDEFGRTLKKEITINFATDHRPPDYQLTNQISILEKDIATEVPVYVTNIDKLHLFYDKITSKGADYGLSKELTLPGIKDLSVKLPMKVRDMLGNESGVVAGSVVTRPYIKKWEDYNKFFIEVTPFQVHVKMGHFNAIAWVTDLATGNPVEDAEVTIYRAKAMTLTDSPEILARGTTGTDGTATLEGLENLDPDTKYIYGYDRSNEIFFTKVEKGKEMALLPMDYNFLMNTYNASHYTVYSSSRGKYGYIRAWGTTAQGVYRAGDTIQYKIYVRNQDNERLIAAPDNSYSLKVIDPMDKTVHEIKDITLSEFGAFDGEFTVPETGAVGWYRFELSASYTKTTWEPMMVLVSDFTPSPFKVTTDLNGKLFRPGDMIAITTLAKLHGGGPYTDASARVTITLNKTEFTSSDPLARGFYFDSSAPETPEEITLGQKEGTIDDKGSLLTDIKLPETAIYSGKLTIESAVRDDRGKYISARGNADYASRERFAGLRSNTWILKQNEPSSVELIVVDESGKPVKGVPVTVSVEHRETKASRVKGAGNAYLTQMNTRWVEDEKRVVTSSNKGVEFSFTPGNAGGFRITASVKDSKEREHSTRLEKWVAGRGVVLWEDDNKNGLDIVPEKNEYRVGEKARYMVKNPFPGAKALITIERYGTIKHWVQTLETATPIIEFEIEKDFVPGYYLSVVVVSPRVEMPLGENDVDLGKPAFRMGYVQGNVADPYKQLSVSAAPERDTYKPGDRVKVNLQASYQKHMIDEPVEFAVAVLDEAVLDLLIRGIDYFDPYKGFYELETLDMLNYSLIMQLVGRQKFEKKGADPAGDGGADLGLRNLFKFVSYWNPSIRADNSGKADIEFEVPDNLTGWRVLVMAVTPGERMGLGQGRFNVNRPTEIRPVMPNQVTEGDSFDAGFSIMNRTEKERELDVNITARGAINTSENGRQLRSTLKVKVKPYKRVNVFMPVKSRGEGKIRFIARAGDSIDHDGAIFELDVRKMASLETSATYGTADSETVIESLKFPDNIRTDTGNLFVNLSPTVIGNLEGAFKYLRDYPYSCWEQKITKAVMASHYINLKRYMAPDFEWKEAGEIPDIMLVLAANYQAPSGGMSFYVPQEQFVSPYLSAYTAVAFNWLKERGYRVPESVENRLYEYLETMLRKDVAPDFYSRGMTSTVRAVTLAALAQKGRLSLDDLNRYYPHVKEMDIFGKAHFLIAASLINGAEEMSKDVFNMIISQSDQTGGKFIINEMFDDGFERILTSPLRTNAAVLSAILAYEKGEEGKRLTKDLPFKMVRYITQTRKQGGRWENTQENVFCMNALVEYSMAYEAVNPDINLTASIGDAALGNAVFRDMTDAPVILKRPLGGGDPGKSTQAKITRDGTGRFYYSVGMSYAPMEMRKDNIDAGIDIRREYSVERDGKWVLLQTPMRIKRGELVRVDLYLSIPAARNFLVVDDHVPGGLEPVNRDLATASTVDADKAKNDYAADSWFFHYSDWSYYGMSRWSFYHKELRHDAARFYSEYLSPGNYHLSYTAQAVAPGEFTVMPTHSEEMYDPDVFGKSAPAVLNVEK